MTTVAARRTAWVLVAVALAAYLGGQVLAGLGGAQPNGQDMFLLALGASFGVVGLLIASSPLRNRIAWVYLGVAVSTGAAALAEGLAVLGLGGTGPWRQVGEVAAVLQSASWMAWVLVPATFLLLWFPDGQLVSARWRWVACAAGVGIAGQYVVAVLRAGPVEDHPEIINPLGVSWITALEPVTFSLTIIAAVASAASVVRRFRRAGGLQRQQIKWLALVATTVAPVILLALATYEAIGPAAANTVIQLAVLSVPIAAGLAILRYRLYDVDLVINRALVYGALTATLVLAYVGVVLVLQLVASPLTEESDLAVAGSTLAVAALFRPARDRIQRWVDRRFYRTRYDTSRMLGSFSAGLRHEVDLDAMARDLRSVVGTAMQPTHLTLWLRGGAR